MKRACGRESSAREKMEKTGFFELSSKEAQMYTSNHLFQAYGGDGQGSWLNVDVCGWHGEERKKEDGSDISLIKWLTPFIDECG